MITLLMVIWSLTAAAQQPVGSVEGTVTDQSGAVVAGARVTVTEKATGRAINTTTNESGYYVVRALLPGVYSVRIEQTGFGPVLNDNVVVQVGQVANVSVELKVGSAQAVVDVSASTDVQVDTARQTVDGVITAKQVEQLPQNARNFLDLARLEPGVIVQDGGAIDPTKVNAFRTVWRWRARRHRDAGAV
ncbi:MAG: carboxypeptidase-like regulatory domain-containing protein [Blastocatellia bacterium]